MCYDGQALVDFVPSSASAMPRTALEDGASLVLHQWDLAVPSGSGTCVLDHAGGVWGAVPPGGGAAGRGVILDPWFGWGELISSSCPGGLTGGVEC